MRVGSDFDKMEFSWFGLDLLEPNSLLTNSLITLTALIFFSLVIRKFPLNKAFYNYWKWLFLLQGISFFTGGLGHVLYNYTGVWGKFVPMVFATGMIMFAEHAMLTLIPKGKQNLFMTISKVKAATAIVILLILMLRMDVENNLEKLLLVPSLNSTIGYFATLFFLGWRYGKRVSKALYLLPISVLVLIPAAIFQMKKINIHPWFDRNDVGHLLIIITLFLYYFAIKGYHRDTEDAA